MRDQEQKPKWLIKSKPKISHSHFKSLYDQIFQEIQTHSSNASSNPSSLLPKRKSVLDILNSKITISQYEPPTQVPSDLLKEKNNSLSRRLSANQHTKIVRNDAAYKACMAQIEKKQQSEKQRELLCANMDKFFKKEPSRGLARSNGKTKVKIIIREVRSMKNIVNHSKPKKTESIKSFRQPKSDFRSISSLNAPRKASLAEIGNQEPLPIIQKMNLAEKPDHEEGGPILEGLKINGLVSSLCRTATNFYPQERSSLQDAILRNSESSQSHIADIDSHKMERTQSEQLLDKGPIDGWDQDQHSQSNRRNSVALFSNADEQSETLLRESVRWSFR